jgi:hypothetical protein
MANPQPDIFIRISKEYHKALRKTRISGVQRQVLDTIMFFTWGHVPPQKEAQISNEMYREETGLSNVAVSKALGKLLGLSLITKNGNYNPPSYSIQKDYEIWKPLPKKVMCSDTKGSRREGKKPITKNGNKRYQKRKSAQITPYTSLRIKELSCELYEFYKNEINPLRKSSQRAKENLSYYLKKYTFEDLKKSIENYNSTLNGSEPKYRKDPANFFGKNERPFIDYLPGEF